MNLTDIAIDIATVSFLLCLGFALRVKIAFFRRYFIPASLIAGILGLLLGPGVGGRYRPFVCITAKESGNGLILLSASSLPLHF